MPANKEGKLDSYWNSEHPTSLPAPNLTFLYGVVLQPFDVSRDISRVLD